MDDETEAVLIGLPSSRERSMRRVRAKHRAMHDAFNNLRITRGKIPKPYKQPTDEELMLMGKRIFIAQRCVLIGGVGVVGFVVYKKLT